MAILTDIGTLVWGYLVPFLFVLTIVVFFHELGHFLVARWCGVKVAAFSVGFGRELVGFDDRQGTRWKISMIPLGGYVKFAGDDNAASVPDRETIAQMSEEERAGSFYAKSVWRRAAVVAAGPIANFILAIVIFAALFGLYGRTYTVPRVDSVQAESAAAEAGFMPGDVVVSVDGEAIRSFADIQRVVTVSAGVPLNISVERDGKRVDLVATPKLREMTDQFGNAQKVGLLGLRQNTRPDDVYTVAYNPLEAVGEGVKETWYVVARTGSYIGGIFAGRESADQLGGPIRVAQFSGQVATLGLAALLNLAAVLSVSIGLINLMPIPMLDGGHLLFYAYEAAFGRPLPEKVQDFGFRIGLALVFMLMIFATFNDVKHLVGG
ncbi:site-2 protease [Breoghania corrubedonensis]|uniref:Zinc metalloprotease n=1 Tax=Breoghania corrubedonensis TaxID=665038 RepID=A0A2T5VBL6_9HYPH|nr:RIP metalloprotease RseP [Breoghania corrubedonensis]PTW61143.1 site-2 protease [Breoghania corrubedonensis]